MADFGFGHAPGTSGIDERLASLRGIGGGAPVTSRKIRLELLVGIAIVLFSLVLVVVLLGNRAPSSITAQPEVVPIETPTPIETGLLAGEAYIPISVSAGRFPPELQVGDTVSIVVVPPMGADEVVRAIRDNVLVHSISAASDIGTDTVVTVQGPHSLGVDIANADRVLISIVEVATK